MRLKAGQNYTPFGCRVTRLLSSTADKSVYEVDWQGQQVVLKLTSAPPLLPAVHPRWAPVLEWANLPDGFAYLQEKVPGSTLTTVLKFGAPSLQQRLDWAMTLAEFFESASPTSGTLEPSNVLVGDRGELRLISLGSPEREETPLASLGRFLELALPDSAPVAWLAARCREGRFQDFRPVTEMLREFSAGEAEPAFELPPEGPARRPVWPIFAAVLLTLVLLLTFWHRPLRRGEPAVYLAEGDTVRLLSESTGRALGSLTFDDEITAMAASTNQGRLYLAYRDSPFIDILEGRTHQPVGRLLSQPGASRLELSGKTLVAHYPDLSLVVLLDTDGKAAQPVPIEEGSRVAVLAGLLVAVTGQELEVYQVAPFALIRTLKTKSPISDLWVEGEELWLAEGERLHSVDPRSGKLRVRPESEPQQAGGLETPHGYWKLQGGRLSKQVGREGSVLQTWSVDPAAVMAYLGGDDAP